MKKLFIDIETAPNVVYAWGLFNQNIDISQIAKPGYTLCWAAKWDHEKKVMFSSIRDGEKEMTEWAHEILSEADAVIHYNGIKFDIPKLNNEFLKYNMAPPASYSQIDLLRTARSQFKLTSNKLDFVCQHLGIGAKIKHKGMQLWIDCMEGDEKAWREMERYNKQDVRLLPVLYERLLPWIKNHPNEGLYVDTDSPICVKCGSTELQRRGYGYTTTQRYPRFFCTSCHSWLMGRHSDVSREDGKNILKAG